MFGNNFGALEIQVLISPYARNFALKSVIARTLWQREMSWQISENEGERNRPKNSIPDIRIFSPFLWWPASMGASFTISIAIYNRPNLYLRPLSTSSQTTRASEWPTKALSQYIGQSVRLKLSFAEIKRQKILPWSSRQRHMQTAIITSHNALLPFHNYGAGIQSLTGVCGKPLSHSCCNRQLGAK